jgi:hypothetical protein
MSNSSDLKKDIAKRNVRDICGKIGSVITKYKMSESCKDELMQVADMVLCLKNKIDLI